MTPSSVVAKYIEDSPFKNSKERPAANLKFMFSTASFLLEGAIRFKSIKSVYYSPFFIDHSVILPSALMLTKLSPLFPLPLLIHCMSHIAFVFLSIDYLFSAIGLLSFFRMSYIVTTPSNVPHATRLGF